MGWTDEQKAQIRTAYYEDEAVRCPNGCGLLPKPKREPATGSDGKDLSEDVFSCSKCGGVLGVKVAP